MIIIILLLFSITTFSSPYEITNLKDNIDCDFLIITDTTFKNTAIDYCKYREENKNDFVTNPKMIYTTTIHSTLYNLPTTDAIKRTIRIIKSKSPKLRFVMLMGSGTISDTTRKNFVPIIKTTNYLFKDNTLYSDDFYVCDSNNKFYNDSINISIGRIEARNIQQAENYLKKVKFYESDKRLIWKNRILVAVDDDSNGYMNYDADVFFHEKAYKTLLKSSIPEYIFNNTLFMRNFPVIPSIKKIDEPDYPAHRPEARDEFLNRLKDGNLVTIFIGHGYYTVNSEEGLMEIYYFDDEKLKPKNDKYTIYLSLSCLTGAFDTEIQPLASQATLRDGFAIAGIASTSELNETQNLNFGNKLISQLYSQKYVALGETVNRAKRLSATNYEHYCNSSYNYFGDPSLVVKVPQKAIENAVSIPDTILLNNKNSILSNNSYNYEFLLSKKDTTQIFYHSYSTTKDTTQITVNGKEIASSTDFSFYNDSINTDKGNLYITYEKDKTIYTEYFKNINIRTDKVSILNNFSQKANSVIYPNPATNKITIKYNAKLFFITNILGKIIKIENKNNINISTLKKGKYYVFFNNLNTNNLVGSFYKTK